MSLIENHYVITQTVGEIDRQKWSSFVEGHPQGNFFHTPDYVDLHREVKGYTPYVVAAFDSREQLVGLLVAIRSSVYNGIGRYVTSRAIVVGGPLIDDQHPEVAEMLLNCYCKTMKYRAIYTQFRNQFDTSKWQVAFQHVNARFEEHLDILIELQKSEETLWQEMHPKRRNKIRQAQKQQVEVRELITTEEREQSWHILRNVYRREKLPLAKKVFFDHAFDTLIPKGYLKVYGAFHHQQLIGTRYVLSYKTQIFDWYAGSDQKFSSLRPNDLLPWEVFLRSKAEGFTRFDFGGAGKPNVPYGVRDYKLRFGGTLVNFGRYEIIHNNVIFAFIGVAFRFWQSLH